MVGNAPRWVAALLGTHATELVARIALTCPFWISGIVKLLDFPAAVAEQAHFGLQPAAALAGLTIAVQLAGSAAVISGRLAWLGAGALGVFTAIATVIAHAYWNLEGHERFMARNIFFEHVAIIAGLWLAAVLAGREAGARSGT